MNLQISIAQSQPSATSQIEIVTPRGLQPVSPRVSFETEADFSPDLPDFVIEEFRNSGISAILTRANIRWMEGESAIAVYTQTRIAALGGVSAHSSGYVTRESKKILWSASHLVSGAWAARGTKLDGGFGDVWQLKPKTPREKPGQGFGEPKKYIKYETPMGEAGLPLLAIVPIEQAERIYARYGVSPLPGETFWQVILRNPHIPIIIVEGFKKALSAIEQGFVAIAARSITQWQMKGTKTVKPEIAQFAKAGRQFLIAFDQDESCETQRAVSKQEQELGRALTKIGAEVLGIRWDKQLGKGLDDVLAGQGSLAAEWLRGAIAAAAPIEEMKALRLIAALERRSQLSIELLRATEGGYLPDLPQLQPDTIYALSAGTDSGKTSAIVEQVAALRAAGKITLILSPSNALGKQIAEKCQIPHIHDFKRENLDNQALWSLVAHECGIVMCPNSLHQIPGWIIERIGLLVMDEANQVLGDMLTGGTLKDELSARYQNDFCPLLRRVCKQAPIILSEANLPQHAIALIQRLSGASRAVAITHSKKDKPRDIEILDKREALWERIIDAIEAGQKIAICADTAAEIEALEDHLKRQYPDLKIACFLGDLDDDDHSKGFYSEPTQWIRREQPDIFLFSPKLKSGISIEGDNELGAGERSHFDQIFQFCSYLTADIHIQMPFRLRQPLPITIYCPEWIGASGDERLGSARRIRQKWINTARIMARLSRLEALLEGQSEQAIADQEAALDYLAIEIDSRGKMKQIARAYLSHRLTQAGHRVRLTQAAKNPEMKAHRSEARDRVNRRKGVELAAITIGPEHDAEWAAKKSKSMECSKGDRLRLRKIQLRGDYPEMPWDDPEHCYQAFYADGGKLDRGVKLQAAAENLEATERLERERLEQILSKEFKALHRLPKRAIAAKLIAASGILDLLKDGTPYSNSDPRCIRIKEKLLPYRADIQYFWGLNLKEDQSPVEIANKILKSKLGLKPKAIARLGSRGDRERFWEITGHDDFLRLEMLESRRRKLFELVSTISIMRSKGTQDPHIKIVDTPQNPSESPPWLEGVPAAEHPELLAMMSEARQAGPEAIEAIEAIAGAMRLEVA